MDLFRGRPLKLLRDPQRDDIDFFPPSLGPNVSIPMPAEAAVAAAVPSITSGSKYQEGGEQTQLTVHQHNFML